MMNWARTIEIPRWTPVRQLGIKVSKIRDILFRVESDCYLIAVQHNEKLEMFPDLHFVTSVLWAESEGAALRAALREIENDRIVVGATPPPEMLLVSDRMTYGQIIDVLKSRKHGEYIEHASYRIARDGAFIHRIVDTHLFEFYFRALTEDKNERPYAILRRL